MHDLDGMTIKRSVHVDRPVVVAGAAFAGAAAGVCSFSRPSCR